MKFKIKADLLTIEGKPCISTEALKLLEDHQITIELNVIEKGKAVNSTKPMMVMIHGNSSSSKVFANQIEHFSKTHYVVAYDLLGHGESTKLGKLQGLSVAEIDLLCENFYHPCSMIAQAVQLFKSLNITESHIIGWSLGGHLGYGIAVEEAGLVSSLTTIGSPPVCFKMAGFKAGFQDFFTGQLVPEWIKHPKSASENEACEIARAVGFLNPESEHSFFVNDFMTTDPLVRKFLFNNNDTNSSKVLDAFSFVNNTRIPLCIMVGENDVGIKSKYFESINNLQHKNSQVHIIKDAPHAVFAYSPDSYFNIIETFLS